jgi:hypothetical protein
VGIGHGEHLDVRGHVGASLDGATDRPERSVRIVVVAEKKELEVDLMPLDANAALEHAPRERVDRVLDDASRLDLPRDVVEGVPEWDVDIRWQTCSRAKNTWQKHSELPTLDIGSGIFSRTKSPGPQNFIGSMVWKKPVLR